MLSEGISNFILLILKQPPKNAHFVVLSCILTKWFSIYDINKK